MTLTGADVRLAAGDHVVQFYETVDGLATAVCGFLTAAISDGDAVVVIASPAHRELFRSGLLAAGVDVDAATADGRLVVLDAATAATGFIVDGSIDRAAFEAVVGAPVRRAAAQHRGVRVYGEMVALLWAAGDVGAAMDLERLWNELAASVPFALFCAYPADLVCDPLAGEAFSEVCHLHSTVLAGAPSLPDSEVTRRFPATVHGPRLARRFVNETLAAWRLEAAADDAAVVVSELVANAVVHARSDAVVGITRAPGGIRLAVADRGSELPARADLDTGALRGRGLAMIAAMAQRWGHQVVEGGKVVWAELPAFGASGAA